MKAIEQYFPVVLFIMLYKVVLAFESVDEILKCDHLRECINTVFDREMINGFDRSERGNCSAYSIFTVAHFTLFLFLYIFQHHRIYR